jgi:1,4-dihydroxy-2-naphthoate octaprenyltransferase
VLRSGILFFAAAILIGFYISATTSWMVALIGSISMAVGYLYTGGPWPIAYTPFGELAAAFFMGPVIVMIAFFIQTGEWSTNAFIASIPIGWLVGNILLANNIRDLDGDKEKGRRTIAILLGRHKAITLLTIVFLLAHVSAVAAVLTGHMPVGALISLILIPRSFKIAGKFRGKTKAIEMMPAMKATAQMHAQYGLLFFIGTVGSIFLS